MHFHCIDTFRKIRKLRILETLFKNPSFTSKHVRLCNYKLTKEEKRTRQIFFFHLHGVGLETKNIPTYYFSSLTKIIGGNLFLFWSKLQSSNSVFQELLLRSDRFKREIVQKILVPSSLPYTKIMNIHPAFGSWNFFYSSR